MSTPPFPCPTKLWYNAPYEEIDPKRPELSAKGKRIIITGGGTGIGRETALAFAAAGAESIVLFGGRREALIKESQKIVEEKFPGIKIESYAADITNLETVKAVVAKISAGKKWDVLVLNAGYLPDVKAVADADLSDMSQGWAINVLGNLQVVQALLPHRGSDAVVIGLSTGAFSLEAKMLVGNAGYVSSKIALAKFMEVMSAEVTDTRWITVHPGVVDTDMLVKSGFHGLVPHDEGALPGHFLVWLASKEAGFLNGKFVWVNWDVAELKSRAEEIQNSPIFTPNIVGWPFDSK